MHKSDFAVKIKKNPNIFLDILKIFSVYTRNFQTMLIFYLLVVDAIIVLTYIISPIII